MTAHGANEHSLPARLCMGTLERLWLGSLCSATSCLTLRAILVQCQELLLPKVTVRG